MNDLLIYCPDYPAFLAELQVKFPQFVNDEAEKREDKILADKTPAHWLDDAFVCRIRIPFELTEELSSIEVVTEDDPRVAEVYPREPVYIEDGDYWHTPPPLGVFA